MNEIDQQIEKLLAKAAEKPMPQDPMNMVGFGSMLLAAKMIELRTRQRLAHDKPLDYGEEKTGE
jgi:hypothetical protein